MHVLHTSASVLLCRLEGSHSWCSQHCEAYFKWVPSCQPSILMCQTSCLPVCTSAREIHIFKCELIVKMNDGRGTCYTPFCKRSESKHQRSLMLSRLCTKLASELVMLFRSQAGAERKCLFCFSCFKGDLKLISVSKGPWACTSLHIEHCHLNNREWLLDF